MNSGAERAAIERQLERIVASSGFARADRLSHFLRFIVAQAVQGKAHELKESVIGVAVYGRRPDYDPKADPTVRVEARKLRVRLQEYYRAAGRADPILIDLPKGRYVPTHCCPVRSPIDSTGCRGRVNCFRSRRPEVPVKWAFARRA